MIQLTVLNAGLFTTVQDLGRMGYQHLGVPVSGVLDRRAAHRANALVSNPVSTPVLEITLRGPRLHFSAAATIAITGAHLSPQLDGESLANDLLIRVRPQQVLDFGRCDWGCRAYLAIHGQWQVDYWLKSASRAVASVVACTPKARLQQGDLLQIDAAQKLSRKGTRDVALAPFIVQHLAAGKQETAQLFATPAPEYRHVSRAWRSAFFTHTYTISTAADRMGYRLEERMRVPQGMGQMLSSGVLPGTVQLTPAGKLIILLADAQTTGGYYRIVQLTPDSLDTLAQLKPGDKLCFKSTSDT